MERIFGAIEVADFSKSIRPTISKRILLLELSACLQNMFRFWNSSSQIFIRTHRGYSLAKCTWSSEQSAGRRKLHVVASPSEIKQTKSPNPHCCYRTVLRKQNLYSIVTIAQEEINDNISEKRIKKWTEKSLNLAFRN